MEEETTALGKRKVTTLANRGQITVAEVGRRGGKSTLRNQGTDFFKSIGRRGGKRTAKLYGHLLRKHGKQGGCPKSPALGKNMGEKHRK